MKREHTTAIVPCKDGASTIASTIASLDEEVLIDEVIVVDDGSSDNTASAAESAGARVVRLDHNLGKGAAMRAGIAAAEHADIFLFVDADTGSTAGHAAALIETVARNEADLAIGVLPPAGGRGGFGNVKKLAQRGIEKACGFDAQAPLSGQRAVKSELIRKIEIADRFAVEVAMTIDAVRSGAVVEEVPVAMEHHHRGKSVAGFAHRGRQGIDVLRALWPRLVPKRFRIAAYATAILLIAAFLFLVPGSRTPDAQPLPQATDVRIQLVPSWLWPESSRDIRGAAAASVVTGDVRNVAAAVAAGSRDPEAEALPDVEVDVETQQSITQRDPTVAPPGIVVVTAGITTGDNPAALRPLIIAGPNISGTLVSSSTRDAGLVDLTDLAPTVLAMKGKPIPDSVDGAPLEFIPDRVANTADLSQRSESATAYDNISSKITVAFVTLQTLLFIVAIALVRSGDRLRRLAVWSLPVAAFPLTTYLVYWISGGRELSLTTWSALSLLVLGIIVAMSLVKARKHRALIGLQRILLATIAVIGLDLATGSHLQESGIFGSSPLLGTRYYGLGNPATTVLLVASVLWCAIHVQRSPNRRIATVRSALLLGGVTIAIGLPSLGADAGGLLAGVFVTAITIALLTNVKLTAQRLLWAAVAAIATCGIAALVDSQRAPNEQSHLGKAFSDGPSSLATTLSDRFETNVVGYGFPWSLSVIAIAVIFAAGLMQRRWQFSLPAGSAQRAGAISAITAASLVYLLNDSGIVVLALAAVFLGPYLMAQRSSAATEGGNRPTTYIAKGASS